MKVKSVGIENPDGVTKTKKKINFGAFSIKNQSLNIAAPQKHDFRVRPRSNSVTSYSSSINAGMVHSGERINNRGAQTHAFAGGRKLIPKDCFKKKFNFNGKVGIKKT